MQRVIIVGACTLALVGAGCGGDDSAELRTEVSQLRSENERLAAELDAVSTTTPVAATTTSTTTTTVPQVTATTAGGFLDGASDAVARVRCLGGWERSGAAEAGVAQADYDAFCAANFPTTSTSSTSTLPPTTAAPIVYLLPEEIAASLAPPAVAWVNDPNGATYDGLAAAAQALLESGQIASDKSFAGYTARELLGRLSPYPGDDEDVYLALDQLGVPGAPAVYGSGTYTVGVDIEPGRYRATDVDGCYWETLDEAGEINDNNFVTAAPQVLMDVRSSDYAVNFEDCGLWVKVG
jgi:hypothetical protein